MLTLVICEDDILAQSLKEDSRSNNEGDEEFSFDNKISDNNNDSEAKTQDSNVQGTLIFLINVEGVQKLQNQ